MLLLLGNAIPVCLTQNLTLNGFSLRRGSIYQVTNFRDSIAIPGYGAMNWKEIYPRLFNLVSEKNDFIFYVKSNAFQEKKGLVVLARDSRSFEDIMEEKLNKVHFLFTSLSEECLRI